MFTFVFLFPVISWNRNAILALIHIYKDVFNDMRNNGIRNAESWKRISEKLKEENFNYSPIQTKNKFSKLKCLYVKSKDSRGPNNSGGIPIRFEYYEEFEDIFGSSHAHGLPGAQSSLAVNSINERSDSRLDESLISEGVLEEDNLESSSEIVEPITNRRRKRKAISEIFNDSVDKLISQRERQHKEKMEKMEQMDKDHKDLLKQLIDKL